jgi:hypothetical protein
MLNLTSGREQAWHDYFTSHDSLGDDHDRATHGKSLFFLFHTTVDDVCSDNRPNNTEVQGERVT